MAGAVLGSLNQTSLAANLGSNVIVGETSCREEWDLLPSGNGVHDVDRGDAGLNHFLRVRAF